VAAKVPTAGLAVEAVAWFAVGGAAGHLLEGMGPATNIWCQSLHNNSRTVCILGCTGNGTLDGNSCGNHSTSSRPNHLLISTKR